MGEQVSDPQYFGDGQGIGIRKEDDELRQALDQALAEIIRNGTYDKLRKRYFAIPIL
ncbi:Lysine/arginine/ornithine-binding periplasmic protein [compost metagenome]